MVIDEWKSCYPSNWKGLIINQAMSHPAKFSSRLIRRIYEHVLAEGWVKKGDKVIDPFGGVSLGGLDAMRVGLDWTGIELEQKFVDLGGERFDCPGFTKQEWIRFYNRARNANYKHNFHWCPECVEKFYKVEKAGIIPEALPHAFVGNIGMWNRKFSRMPNWGKARLLQGDSRKLLAVLGCDFMAVVGSPPYAEISQSGGTKGLKEHGTGLTQGERCFDKYGSTDGQLGAMPDSDFDLALGSPPYAGVVGPNNGGQRGQSEFSGDGGEIHPRVYGSTDGQLSAMSDSDFDLALGSPPFGSSQQVDNRKKPSSAMSTFWDNHMGFTTDGDNPGNLANLPDSDFDLALGSPPFMQSEGGTPEPKPGGSIDKALYARHAAGNAKANGYGTSEGQLSSMEDSKFSLALGSPPYYDSLNQESVDPVKRREREERYVMAHPEIKRPPFRDYGEHTAQLSNGDENSFWLAAREIVDQVYAALRPGGHAVWVVKAYVKNKTYIDFPGQWRQLCEAAGFVTLHEHRALLVHHKGTSTTLDGQTVEHKTESKSFFRRLAEKKGSPRIDHETVYCMGKPTNSNGGGAHLAVGSPPFSDSEGSTSKNFYEWKNAEIKAGRMKGDVSRGDPTLQNGYGTTPGQLGAMKDSDFDLVVGSPPFQGTHDGLALKDSEKIMAKVADRYGNNKNRLAEEKLPHYGAAPGQLGAMKDSDFDRALDG